MVLHAMHFTLLLWGFVSSMESSTRYDFAPHFMALKAHFLLKHATYGIGSKQGW